MSELLSKIQDFFFDILGLAVPGVIFIILIISPIILFDFSHIDRATLLSSHLLLTMSIIKVELYKLYLFEKNYFFIIFLGSGYIIGHLIKVFSIIFYEVMTTIFDKSINILARKLTLKIYFSIDWLISKIFGKHFYEYTMHDYLHKILLKPFLNIIRKVFVFSAPRYDNDNEGLEKYCSDFIRQNTSVSFPKSWYPLYKFSVVLHSQEKIKSLTQTFLAKYNLYRSLSFIAVLCFAFFTFFFSIAEPYITTQIFYLHNSILIVTALLWFTFHSKYKRYWTLCGNEALVSLFYYLNKNKLI